MFSFSYALHKFTTLCRLHLNDHDDSEEFLTFSTLFFSDIDVSDLVLLKH